MAVAQRQAMVTKCCCKQGVQGEAKMWHRPPRQAVIISEKGVLSGQETSG